VKKNASQLPNRGSNHVVLLGWSWSVANISRGFGMTNSSHSGKQRPCQVCQVAEPVEAVRFSSLTMGR
jgi:hypothetical protein